MRCDRKLILFNEFAKGSSPLMYSLPRLTSCNKLKAIRTGD